MPCTQIPGGNGGWSISRAPVPRPHCWWGGHSQTRSGNQAEQMWQPRGSVCLRFRAPPKEPQLAFHKLSFEKAFHMVMQITFYKSSNTVKRPPSNIKSIVLATTEELAETRLRQKISCNWFASASLLGHFISRLEEDPNSLRFWNHYLLLVLIGKQIQCPQLTCKVYRFRINNKFPLFVIFFQNFFGKKCNRETKQQQTTWASHPFLATEIALAHPPSL